MSRTAAGSIIGLALTALVSAQSPSPALIDTTRPVSDLVIAAASRSRVPEEFAHALASLWVPAGVVLEVGGTPTKVFPFLRFDDRVEPGSRSLGDALDTFERSHPDYVVEGSRETGYVFRPRTSGCAASLSKRVTVRLRGPVFATLDQLRLVVNPAAGPHVPPGLVGGGGTLDRRESALVQTVIDIDVKGQTVQDALLAVSRAAPGVVWTVQERPDARGGKASCVLGLMTANTTVWTSCDINP